MKEKLLELMKSEDLRPGQFAEMLGVNPAGISHILAGRNKPGFDLLQKILNRFPRVNPDWLIMDKGPMYRSDGDGTAPYDENHEPLSAGHVASSGVTSEQTGNNEVRATTTASSINSDLFSTVSREHGRVKKIVIFYEDGTFESFSPVQ